MANWKEFGRKWSCPNTKYYPNIFPEGLEEFCNGMKE
jgi:hypothetical protein